MTGTRITLTGADKAHYLNATGLSSRVVRFPDGITRHVTLTNWEWEVVDWHTDVEGWPRSALPELAYQHATEFCKDPSLFEDQIRRSFSFIIREGIRHRLGFDDPVNQL